MLADFYKNNLFNPFPPDGKTVYFLTILQIFIRFIFGLLRPEHDGHLVYTKNNQSNTLKCKKLSNQCKLNS